MSLHAILLLVVSSAAVLSLAVVALHGHGEREEEDAARDHFTRTGRWPDEESAPRAAGGGPPGREADTCARP